MFFGCFLWSLLVVATENAKHKNPIKKTRIHYKKTYPLRKWRKGFFNYWDLWVISEKKLSFLWSEESHQLFQIFSVFCSSSVVKSDFCVCVWECACVCVCVKERTRESEMKLKIKNRNGKVLTEVDLSESATVGDLKALFHKLSSFIFCIFFFWFLLFYQNFSQSFFFLSDPKFYPQRQRFILENTKGNISGISEYKSVFFWWSCSVQTKSRLFFRMVKNSPITNSKTEVTTSNLFYKHFFIDFSLNSVFIGLFF